MRFPISLMCMVFIMVFIMAGTSFEVFAQKQDQVRPEDFQAGQEYFELPAPKMLYGQDDGQVEVLSFFWYNCGACYRIEPALEDWAKKLPPGVRLVRLPFFSKEPTIFHARLAFSLESLGLGPDINRKVFDLFQKQGQPVYTEEGLPQLAKALKINEKELLAAFNSPEVEAKIQRLGQVLEVYHLAGVPAMVIDGRYRFDVGTTHGAKNYLELADILITRQLKIKAAK